MTKHDERAAVATDEELDRIVAGLTVAQRNSLMRALVGEKGTAWLSLNTRSPTLISLYLRGLSDYDDLPARLTPLGLAVRNRIMETTK